jgi:hypothetical protein
MRLQVRSYASVWCLGGTRGALGARIRRKAPRARNVSKLSFWEDGQAGKIPDYAAAGTPHVCEP